MHVAALNNKDIFISFTSRIAPGACVHYTALILHAQNNVKLCKHTTMTYLKSVAKIAIIARHLGFYRCL